MFKLFKKPTLVTVVEALKGIGNFASLIILVLEVSISAFFIVDGASSPSLSKADLRFGVGSTPRI